MKEKYFEIYTLLDQLNDPVSRLKRVHEIIQKPDFQYEKEGGGDLILSMFLASSYWLDRELFDESYLCRKQSKNLLPSQNLHLKMLDIGVSLLEKGFPLEYNSLQYNAPGLSQIGNYVKIFSEQCKKRYTFLHKKTAHKKKNLSLNNFQKIMV